MAYRCSSVKKNSNFLMASGAGGCKPTTASGCRVGKPDTSTWKSSGSGFPRTGKSKNKRTTLPEYSDLIIAVEGGSCRASWVASPLASCIEAARVIVSVESSCRAATARLPSGDSGGCVSPAVRFASGAEDPMGSTDRLNRPVRSCWSADGTECSKAEAVVGSTAALTALASSASARRTGTKHRPSREGGIASSRCRPIPRTPSTAGPMRTAKFNDGLACEPASHCPFFCASACTFRRVAT